MEFAIRNYSDYFLTRALAAAASSSSSMVVAASSSSALVALLLAILPILSITILLRTSARGGPRYPPGPAPLPVLGNLLHLAGRKPPHQSLADLARTFGAIFHLRLGSQHAVVVSSAALAHKVLQGGGDRCFASRPRSESAERMSYGQERSIAMGVYGPRWRELRRVCTMELFTAGRVQAFLPIRAEEVRGCVRQIMEQCGASGGAPARALDLTAAIAGLVESILCRVLTSRRLPEVAIQDLLRGGVTLKDLIHRMVVIAQVPVVGDFIPWLGFLDRKLKSSMDELHGLFDKLFETLLHERANDHLKKVENDHAHDFLDVLLSNSMEKDNIKSLLLEMLSAGIDTTAVTIDWAMAEVLSNPKVLDKIQVELDDVIGRERMVEESDLSRLVYLKAVVKETLRLHPPLPLLIPHMSMEASEIDGYNLPKDTILIVNVWAIGRDPQSWDDPYIFNPERFLENVDPIDIRGKHFELLPFGSGRRICPGLPLALPTLELALSNLFHSFHWRLSQGSPSIDLSEKPGIVSSRASPLLVIASPRLNPILFSSI